MKHEPLSFDDFAALYESVSRMPEPLNDAEFMRAIQANTPASVRDSNRQVSVTLSIWVNADGSVRSVRAIVPELPPGITVRGIKLESAGSTSVKSRHPRRTRNVWRPPKTRPVCCASPRQKRTANPSNFPTCGLASGSRGLRGPRSICVAKGENCKAKVQV
jgi:hypothetical protein